MKKKANIAWNLEVISNPKTRPNQIVEIGGNFMRPSGMNSTVYRFTNLDNNKWYIGFHKESHKAYFSSTTNSEFKSVLANPKSNLKFEIIDWGSVEECKQIEYELLTESDAKNNPMSYNLHNGRPGKTKLNIDLVKDLVNDLNVLRRRQKGKLFHFDEKTHVKGPEKASVLYTFEVLQTRELQIDNKNLEFVKDRIVNVKQDYGTYDLPVFLQDVQFEGDFYSFLLISGNHTITAYNVLENHYPETPLNYVVIPPDIHQGLSEMEIRMISNDLNANYRGGKPFSKADAVKECLGHHNNGYSWNTNEMQQRFLLLGLTKKQITGVVNDVLDKIEKQKQKAAGMVVMNYSSKHKAVLDLEVRRRQTEDLFVVPWASTTPNLNRILSKWKDDQEKRFELGKPIQDKILVLVHHQSLTTKNNFESIKKNILSIQDLLESYNPLLAKFRDKISEHVKHPKILFEELDMYISDTAYKEKMTKQIKAIFDEMDDEKKVEIDDTNLQAFIDLTVNSLAEKELK